MHRAAIALLLLAAAAAGLVILTRPLLRALFRSLEFRQLYFPTRAIEATPRDIGLRYEDISFPSPDGLTLNAWFVAAENPAATVLFCHGNGGNISHRLELLEFFNRLRLNVLIFDYRGYGRSEGSPYEEGTYWDALGAFTYLVGRDDVDAEKTILYGRSLGGAIAVDLATRVECAGLICENCPSSIVEMAKIHYPIPRIENLISNRYEAIARIAQVKMPVLIIHSRHDELVPFEQGRRLFEAAEEPKEFLATFASHNDPPSMMNQEYRERLARFVERCLGGSS